MPKTRCCRSLPRCRHCPVLLAAGTRATASPSRHDVDALVRDVMRGRARTIPEPFAEALGALALARDRQAAHR